jgi:hypothetical protein
MTLTPEAVFRSLSETFRKALLAHRAIQPSDEILAGDLSRIAGTYRDRLHHDLNCIATLGGDHAAQLVHDYLSDAGWMPEDFAATHSTRERACALLCGFPEDFNTALSIWNGNRLRSRLDREQGFRLPELPEFTFQKLTEAQEQELKELIRDAVLQSYPAKAVSRVTVFERTARGLSTDSDTVLQCDVSMGDDPEAIDVIEGGTETTITITRLSVISVIIDPLARSLFVGTTLGKKALHQAVAKAIVKILFSIDANPEQLKPLRVYPERCRQAVKFAFNNKDGIETPRISALHYRLYGTPVTLQFSVREEDPATLLHSHLDVLHHAKRMRIWRAVIDFEFKAAGDRTPLRRAVTLNEPSGISFGRAFPEERLIIERVLVKSGLIDPNFNWQDLAQFSNLSRLVTPHHEAELSQSWLPLTITALRDAGILVPGAPHPRAWCRACGETHEIGRRETDDRTENYIQCPDDPCILTDDHIDTLELSSEGLLAWLRQHAVSSNDRPEPIGPASAQAWFLGFSVGSVKGKPFRLIVARDVDYLETASALNDFLLHRYPDGPGLILTLTEDPVQKVFPNSWRSAPLSSVCELRKSGLIYQASAAAAMMRGRPSEKSQKSEEEWETIRLLFIQMFPGTGAMQAYTVARALIAAEPEICDMTPASLVPRLKTWAPERFAK